MIGHRILTNIHNRVGCNSLPPPEEESLISVACIFPGSKVIKVGRTTGRTEGVVNAAVIQSWQDGVVTVELGVIGTGGLFADKGDLGALCVQETADGTLHAAGLVIGKNTFLNLALVTPIAAVLDSIHRRTGLILGLSW